jgi:ATP-dependent DNA helicase RecG
VAIHHIRFLFMLIFEFLNSPLTKLKQVGPKNLEILTNLIGQNKIFDLLLHFPIRIEKILFKPKIYDTKDSDLITAIFKIESHQLPNTSKQPFKIIGYNPSGYVTLIFFKTYPTLLQKLAIGKEVAICGKIQKNFNGIQISHPSYILDPKLIDNIPKINIIYPLTYKLTQNFLSSKINDIVEFLNKNQSSKELQNIEWLDLNLLKQQNWPGFIEALNKIHHPIDEIDLLPDNKARKRLAYDELLAWQLAIFLSKEIIDKSKEKIVLQSDLPEKFLSNLPFHLTAAQKKVITEIKNDILSSKKMLRLLQGDVGSGKTIIAIYTALLMVAAKKQACIIVPISILATQHFSYLQKFLQNLDVKIALLTSKTSKKERRQILLELESGAIDIIIGTHSLIQDEVKFKDLGLAIIDEQHRFGVMQRVKLVAKNNNAKNNAKNNVDVLLMSATPIPRSLMMTLYGDMEISILDQKPPNRQEIETLVISQKRQAQVIESIKRAIARGEKIYWICPAISESEISELVSAESKYQELITIFDPEIIGLVHGKITDNNQEKIIDDFASKNGKIKILVATTVIEVGIDVSDATVIIIENAENFGLSQLHQLRGRVGRDQKKSYALLLYSQKISINGKKRLAILRNSNDGFLIAESDLEMRGSGELIGTKQSGLPEFKIANLNFDAGLLKTANKNAKLILNNDPNLSNPKNQIYIELLKLFNYHQYLNLISSG